MPSAPRSLRRGVGARLSNRSLGQLLSDLLPTLVGSSKLHTTAAIEPFRANGLHSALYVVPLLGVLLAAVLFAASRTVAADVGRLQAWMREQGQPRS